MPPSDRQLMGIGASEHRAFVRAKSRFAGQKAQEHILSVEMLLYRTYCHVSLVAFSGGKCRACLALPEVPASDLPVLIHSRWLLPDPLRCPPLPGVSLFWRFRSHLRRVTQASRPGTMAAGAREQAASCDAFVLSRRPPAPGAPPNRTSTACLVAKPSPNHGPVSG